MIQNFASPNEITTLAGGAQSITGGPVASQEAIKELGTNGGGFYNANSAHPFENPTPWTNLVQIFLLLLIPVSLPRTFGRLVGNVRQGYAILAAMAVIALVSIAITTSLEITSSGAALEAAGAATEGKEARFGVPSSSLFASATTLTSTGAVNSFHSSYTALGGGMLILNMALGEIAPGGVGSGLYGMLVLAILTVFIAGLMVGRTPEYVGKKITAREMKLVSLYILTTPALVLSGTALALALPTPPDSILNAGPHGLSEVLYAFHVREQQQRQCLRWSRREHALLQHRLRHGDGAGTVPPHRVRHRARWFVGATVARPRNGRHAADDTAAIRRACSWASSSSLLH